VAEKKSLSDHPSLLFEWDYEKNKNLSPSLDKFSGRTKLWWKCKKGHSWDAILTNRINGSGCPFCAGKRILKGFNDVLTLNPDLVNNEWDFDKNTLCPSEIGLNSSKKVWWKCLNSDHSYESTTASRKRGRGCPYCTNKKVLIGFNDFASQSSELLSEWDFSKNKIDPTEITSGSDKAVWWVCANSHSYNMSAYKRSIGRGCPVCAGKTVIFETSVKGDSHMSELWDYEKNSVDPELISTGSNKLCWWIGKDCGHRFEKSPKFIKNGSECPYCASANPQVLKGFNDLQTKAPHLVREWSKKNLLSPSDFIAGSKKKVWWVCNKGHEWETAIEYRYKSLSSCPKCSMKGTSKTEKEVQNFVEHIISDNSQIVFNSYQIIPPQELDIYIPSKNIAIEFNGLYWHSEMAGKDKNYHYDKWKKCQDQGIQLITIWEDDWKNNRLIVESMLKHKLILSDTDKIYARKSFFKEISYVDAESFLNKHHIQKYKGMTKNFGLFDTHKKELIAVMSFSSKNNILSLERYATSVNVVGGFSKMLKNSIKYFKNNNPNIDTVVTFSDHEVSDGELYKKNGFEVDYLIDPDYKYIYKNQRFHKFSFRKIRFEKDSELIFKKEMTEKELADLNGIFRIWDSGKTKYIKMLDA